MAIIHLVYVRIPGKGIALYRLLWGGDDNTSEIGIGNVISMDLTAQTAPAASEIFNETASTGDAWFRQRKQPYGLRNIHRNCFHW